MSDLRHVKHFKAVYSVKTETKTNLSSKHWLNYLHQFNHGCKTRVVYEIDARHLNFNHTTEYDNIRIGCDGPKIRMYARSYITAVPTDLMVI